MYIYGKLIFELYSAHNHDDTREMHDKPNNKYKEISKNSITSELCTKNVYFLSSFFALFR